MALSVNYATRVISVPRTDMALLQSNPVEVRELNLNSFRLELKDWEDSEQGMFMPTTHNHVSPVSVGGVTLARVVELINNYTVTFEDGQYAVNLAGANSNVGDRVNVNQVSVRSANSAGLLQTREIEYASFGGGVSIDVLNGTAGTAYPIGTLQAPVSNLTDAKLIASVRGFNQIFVIGALTLGVGDDFEGYSFIGDSKNRTHVTVNPLANVFECEFYNMHVDGTLDGDSVIRDCVIDNLTYVSGFIEQCVLDPGTIALGGNTTAHFLDCYSGVPGLGTPTIDMGGDGPALALRNYNGGIQLVNKSGTDAVSIDLNSGQVILDSTVTNGTIVIRGVGKLTNNATGTAVVNSEGLVQGALTNSELQAIAGMVLDMADTVEPGLTVRGSLRLTLAALAGKVSGAGGTNVVFRNAAADTKDRISATVDTSGNRTVVTVDPT